MKVYIVVPDYGYDGYGTPEVVLKTMEAAEKYVEKNVSRFKQYEIVEMDLEEGVS